MKKKEKLKDESFDDVKGETVSIISPTSYITIMNPNVGVSNRVYVSGKTYLDNEHVDWTLKTTGININGGDVVDGAASKDFSKWELYLH